MAHWTFFLRNLSLENIFCAKNGKIHWNFLCLCEKKEARQEKMHRDPFSWENFHSVREICKYFTIKQRFLTVIRWSGHIAWSTRSIKISRIIRISITPGENNISNISDHCSETKKLSKTRRNFRLILIRFSYGCGTIGAVLFANNGDDNAADEKKKRNKCTPTYFLNIEK